MELFRKLKYNHDLQLIIIAVGYVLAAQAGLALTFPETKSIPLYPAAGFGLAIFLMYGTRIWPAIALGALSRYESR